MFRLDGYFILGFDCSSRYYLLVNNSNEALSRPCVLLRFLYNIKYIEKKKIRNIVIVVGGSRLNMEMVYITVPRLVPYTTSHWRLAFDQRAADPLPPPPPDATPPPRRQGDGKSAQTRSKRSRLQF